MRLIFVNRIGKNFMGENIFEFLFSDLKIGDLDGSDWDRAGYGLAPKLSVKKAYRLQTSMDFHLVQEDESFTTNHAVSGIVALAWDMDDESFENRIVFKFGDSIESVQQTLYKSDNYIEISYDNEH